MAVAYDRETGVTVLTHPLRRPSVTLHGLLALALVAGAAVTAFGDPDRAAALVVVAVFPGVRAWVRWRQRVVVGPDGVLVVEPSRSERYALADVVAVVRDDGLALRLRTGQAVPLGPLSWRPRRMPARPTDFELDQQHLVRALKDASYRSRHTRH